MSLTAMHTLTNTRSVAHSDPVKSHLASSTSGPTSPQATHTDHARAVTVTDSDDEEFPTVEEIIARLLNAGGPAAPQAQPINPPMAPEPDHYFWCDYRQSMRDEEKGEKRMLTEQEGLDRAAFVADRDDAESFDGVTW